MTTIFTTTPPTLKYNTWSDFKKFIDGTYSSLAFSWSDKGGVYTIITEEIGGICKEITIFQDSGADQLDFENNFKNLLPRKPGTYSSWGGDGYITIQGKVGGIAVPISAASLPLPTGAATETTLGTRLADSTFTTRINTLGQKTMANSTPVVLASDQSTITITGAVTVSGTVTSNQGTANSLANAWPIKISDGTNSAPLTNAAPVGNEQALVVRNIPSGTQTISGSVTATVSGTVTANQGTAQSLSNPWPVQLSNGTNTPIITNTTPGGSDQALVVRNIPSGTQTISGTVTANAGTGNFTVVQSTASNLNAQVAGMAADGASPVGNPVLIAGQDGTNVQSIKTDSVGRVEIVSSGATASTKGFAAGEVVLATTTISPIRSTTYNEPSVGAQRSMASANAADTAAGTGARTVRITYFTLSAGVVAGPFTETITLSGTTPVNTVATNICYIEKMEVITVGSGGVNAGIITLYASTAGGGGTVWTIAASANRTHAAHHYVSSGKTCSITAFMGGIKGTDTSGFIFRAKDPTNANSAEVQMSDLLRAPASGSTPIRVYGTAIEIVGPSRVTAFAVPDSTSSRTYYASFDFYEQ